MVFPASEASESESESIWSRAKREAVTGASLWQNHRPAGQLERFVSALYDTNGLMSSLNFPQIDQPLFHYPPWVVCVSGCIGAFLSFCVFGGQTMRRDRGSGVRVSSHVNRCVSFYLFVQCVSLCMLLEYVSSSVPLQCTSGVRLHLHVCAYCVFVCAPASVKID